MSFLRLACFLKTWTRCFWAETEQAMTLMAVLLPSISLQRASKPCHGEQPTPPQTKEICILHTKKVPCLFSARDSFFLLLILLGVERQRKISSRPQVNACRVASRLFDLDKSVVFLGYLNNFKIFYDTYCLLLTLGHHNIWIWKIYKYVLWPLVIYGPSTGVDAIWSLCNICGVGIFLAVAEGLIRSTRRFIGK